MKSYFYYAEVRVKTSGEVLDRISGVVMVSPESSPCQSYDCVLAHLKNEALAGLTKDQKLLLDGGFLHVSVVQFNRVD